MTAEQLKETLGELNVLVDKELSIRFNSDKVYKFTDWIVGTLTDKEKYEISLLLKDMDIELSHNVVMELYELPAYYWYNQDGEETDYRVLRLENNVLTIIDIQARTLEYWRLEHICGVFVEDKVSLLEDFENYEKEF